MVRILVVEDDQTLLKVFCRIIEKQGYTTFAASDGNRALEIMDHEYIDLLITDIMMPDMDGFTLVEILREHNFKLPVIVVTAKDQLKDKERGYALGIDDYMVKPIITQELILRIQAVLRRSQIAAEKQLSFHSIVLEYENFTVTRKDDTIQLPQKEFLLLYKLLSYPGKIFTRQSLMEEIWGLDTESDIRTVDVHINRLRDKFYGWKEFSIVTIRGLGYKAVIQ